MGKGKCRSFLVEKLNMVSLGKKLWIMQIFCVILPLFVTDGIIWGSIVRSEQKMVQQEMKNIASAVTFTLNNSIENAILLTQRIYSNYYLNEYIDRSFDSHLDYYTNYLDFSRKSSITLNMGNELFYVVIYADNDGIINGGYFRSLDEAVDTEWYQKLQQSEEESIIYSDYINAGTSSRREISLMRWMNYYHKDEQKDVIKLSLDYSSLLQSIINAKYTSRVYICEEDKILFSNDGRGGVPVPFEKMEQKLIDAAGLHQTMTIYGKTWDIYVMKPEPNAIKIFQENMWLIVCLICANLILPFLLMRLINRSFTERLKELEAAFGAGNQDELRQLPEIQGNDEISALMGSYNQMAKRMNELIKTVYKNRLKSQEMDIARQKAELLALHSQINPHFLFNALESIRMHSVLKKEYETADMVQKLALMERQNVEWGNDFVQIKDEMKFIEAYLELQKYRFGPKLTYEINVDDKCQVYWIPKLTLVTFVENACVHGMEKKTSTSWIFVRIYLDDVALIIEVEDTGSGMPEAKSRQFVEEMTNVTIEKLKEHSKVGMLNAALRLKMATDNQVRFEMDSEMGAGTLVTIRIPLEIAEKINAQEEVKYVKGTAGR